MANLRRQRFIAYFNGSPLKGSREKLMQRTNLTKGRVSQLFDEKQPFGELAARNLAQGLGLPEDYFEHDHPAPGEGFDPDTKRFAEMYQRLSADERHKLRLLYNVARDGVNPTHIQKAPKTGRESASDGGDSGLTGLDVVPPNPRKKKIP